MMNDCAHANSIKQSFFQLAQACNTSLDWNTAWQSDYSPHWKEIKNNSAIEALDLLMSIIKFYIWSRFASYMFGDSPNINIMSSHIFKRSFQTLKLIARRHPKATSIETSHSNIRCPAGWELVLEQFVE